MQYFQFFQGNVIFLKKINKQCPLHMKSLFNCPFIHLERLPENEERIQESLNLEILLCIANKKEI